MNKQIKIALIKPPIIGHLERGTGVYTKQLFKSLKETNDIQVQLIEYADATSSFDLVHYPYFDPFFLTLPRRKPKRFIVTVHDLIPLKFPDQFPKGVKGALKWTIQHHALKSATAVITDSFASVGDIENYANITRDKIRVVYLGVEDEFCKINSQVQLRKIRKNIQLPRRFVLHVGDVNYNKNITGLIQGFNYATKTIPDLSLVCLGQGFVTPSKELDQLLTMIHQLHLDNNIYRLGHVSKEELISLYNIAEIYLQPSFSEGFGLPVLEAMACGTPVIASNRDSLGEILDDASVQIDPQNYNDIGNKIVILLRDDNMRLDLSMKGIQNAKKYTWQRTAQETIKVYKSII